MTGTAGELAGVQIRCHHPLHACSAWGFGSGVFVVPVLRCDLNYLEPCKVRQFLGKLLGLLNMYMSMLQ